MPEICLPQKIIYGADALKKIPKNDYSHILIVSDGGIVEDCGFIHSMEQRYKKMISQPITLVNQNIEDLYNSAKKYLSVSNVDIIIAVGSAAVIDCVSELCTKYKIKYIAAPSSLLYCIKTMPQTVVLDTHMIKCVNSVSIAYDSMAAFSLACEAMYDDNNQIVHLSGLQSACDILQNIVPAFRGEINALEKIMYSMFIASISYMNAANNKDSLFEQVIDFFSAFGFSKSSVSALCIPDILECSGRIHELAELSIKLGNTKISDNEEYSAEKIIEKIRSTQAIIGIPRSMKAFGISESEYIKKAEKNKSIREITDLCYYGSFRFAKL